MTELDIWLDGAIVATAAMTSRGRKVAVTYTDAATEANEQGDPILSCSLPALPGANPPAASRAFLEGLLPEGRALQIAAAHLHGVGLDSSGAPETAADSIRLLAEYGRDCAGAVSVLPAGEPPSANARPSAPLTDEELGSLIVDLPVRPLGADPGKGIRMSLGGAQDKLLLTRVGDDWCTPLDGYPSTHILKPATVWSHSAENEALVMTLARTCTLSDTDVWVESIGGRSTFVTTRYDRMVGEDGTITRIHQEDMCQALGIRPKDKYHVGRPAERMARILREFADSPGHEVLRLFRQVAFRALVGDEDGHGKNYSLLLRGGSATVAPIYDSLCTLYYPELSARMALPIGTQTSLAKVDRAALIAEARAMLLREADAQAAIDDLIAGVRAGLESLPDEVTSGWPSHRLITTITDRARRLESGQPLGGNGSRSRRPTLDEATARRHTP
ncbi:HipA domain-containing protein [Gordonia sp. VNQ95]|uniref:HipA domain-containing protein n=1 Tax=Gordonia TaxID=2053 RepID=UPI0032B31D72